MDLTTLKKEKEAARGRMNRAEKVRQHVLSKLCKLNAEYYKARDEFYKLDRQIAEQFIEELPPARKGEKGGKKKGSQIPKELRELTSDQINMLKSMIDKEKGEG